jgi:hypothetical protein
MDRDHSSHTTPLRIGLLVDSPYVSKYDVDFVKWANARTDLVAITHLVILARVKEPRKLIFFHKLISSLRRVGLLGTFRKASSLLLFYIIRKIEWRLLKRRNRYKDHLDVFDISAIVPSKLIIKPFISKSGYIYRFNDEDVKKVKTLNLDILLRCGSGILRGDILTAATFGIISFHHGDNRINRGGPAGFWEVYRRHDTTGFILQRLTEELDGGHVLMRGHFQTQYYFLLNQAAIRTKSNYYLKSLVEKIAIRRQLPDALPSAPYSNRLFRVPTALEALIYLAGLAHLIAKSRARHFLKIESRWTVAYVQSDWKTCVLWRGQRLPNLPSHYCADPFVISRDNKDYCFVEDYDYLCRRGRITVYELTPSEARLIGVAIDEPFHLSFPYIFQYEGNLFMCPETSNNRDIRIYRCVKFPTNWILEKIIMKDISAADNIILEKGGKWWLLTNTNPMNPVEDGDHDSELSIFWSATPLGDQWTPHPLNPILVDAGRARNAGLLRDGDVYYRVSQGQGFDRYGRRAFINKIVDLDDSSYIESTLCEIGPSFDQRAEGIHHFYSNGKVTVFDFVKYTKTNTNMP